MVTERCDTFHYPPTGEIMARLRRLEKKIGTAMDELEGMLNG